MTLAVVDLDRLPSDKRPYRWESLRSRRRFSCTFGAYDIEMEEYLGHPEALGLS